ncbi:unnamed protein product [Didymodactylos carnosus]|uniref:Uncharacterized protein n=1 Tax=Didymodactylos carnosus TaxID=1234261 RepID=A0A813ZC45_9BILA|nr:unnamed protein product [Didymodactylos carnosus]CAF1260189.1 unnamed protein product [Didymodactylos carnosus]CAF3679626.1 unnamed protein product [Didymodactylos carnosus]CAF4066873.1 unnamed protein product [Didymodactylos carnosus]
MLINSAHRVLSNDVRSRISTSLTKSIDANENINRPKTTVQFINHNGIDTFRREIINKEAESRRLWAEKFNPWLSEEYQKMYENMARNRNVFVEPQVISLHRPEWKQEGNVLPPLEKRRPGERRRRKAGAFPETENDKIGWRCLPHQSIEIYGSNRAKNIAPLPKQYKFSSWPVESFY